MKTLKNFINEAKNIDDYTMSQLQRFKEYNRNLSKLLKYLTSLDLIILDKTSISYRENQGIVFQGSSIFAATRIMQNDRGGIECKAYYAVNDIDNLESIPYFYFAAVTKQQKSIQELVDLAKTIKSYVYKNDLDFEPID